MRYLMYGVLILGIFEILSNSFHLSKGSIETIGRSAKRQHQELPLNIAETHFFIKAIIMLAFGLMFLISSILFMLDRDYNALLGYVSFVLFAGYGLAQAIIYRKTVNVWPATLVYATPLVLLLILR